MDFWAQFKKGGYNLTSRPAVRLAKIYLARPLPAPGMTTTPAAGVEDAGVEEGPPV